MVFVDVFRGWEGAGFAVEAAGTNDGEFGVEGDPLFQYSARRVECGPELQGIGGFGDFDLSFAVIAEVGGFQYGGSSNLREGGGEGFRRIDDAKRCAGEAVREQEVFFTFAVLADVEHFATRADRLESGNHIKSGSRDVFKFEGDHIHTSGECFQRGGILVGGIDLDIAHLAGWAVRLGFVSVHTVAHAAGSNGQHAAELATAENAHDTAGRDGFGFRPA